MEVTTGINMIDLKPKNLSIFKCSDGIDNINEVKKDDIITLKDKDSEFKIKVTNVKEGKSPLDKTIEFERL